MNWVKNIWGLASKYGIKDSKEDWISKVIEMNNLYDTSIKPGDVIVIPKVSENYHLNYGTEVAGE
ncbi:MAG: LysM peptidoglycan-binding domain-containing protein [Psychrobacillus sp.]